MSMINYASREINCKIVYYGSGLGGKTTNLEHVYTKVQPDTRGKLISLATETERTLFFDFLPVDLGTIRGFKTRFHLYTVPGQVYYNASRKLILKGVDGLVFVADSQLERMEANQEAMQNLYDNMAEYGYDLTKMPFIIQYNKRDLPNAAPIKELQAALNPGWEITDPTKQRVLKVVGTTTLIKVTGETEAPATLTDVKADAYITGSYKKAADGSLEAVKVTLGKTKPAKTEGDAKKPVAEPKKK